MPRDRDGESEHYDDLNHPMSARKRHSRKTTDETSQFSFQDPPRRSSPRKSSPRKSAMSQNSPSRSESDSKSSISRPLSARFRRNLVDNEETDSSLEQTKGQVHKEAISTKSPNLTGPIPVLRKLDLAGLSKTQNKTQN